MCDRHTPSADVQTHMLTPHNHPVTTHTYTRTHTQTQTQATPVSTTWRCTGFNPVCTIGTLSVSSSSSSEWSRRHKTHQNCQYSFQPRVSCCTRKYETVAACFFYICRLFPQVSTDFEKYRRMMVLHLKYKDRVCKPGAK